MAKQLLIIENDIDTLDILETVVGEMGLFITTTSDRLLSDRLAEISPDIILLDHWLNSGFGADYCKDLKADERFKHIPVILISAAPELKAIAQESGADDFIEKPFNIDHLKTTIGRYLK